FGVVHRAYQPSVGREVAIKTIRPEYANEPGFIRHFEVEAQLVARLEHPHVVPLHDYWRTPDGAYLVMRWMAGGTLAARVAEGRLDATQADALIDQIAPALAFAHKNGVIHRDINLSNILLDGDGEAYLSDFGIARFEPNAPTGSIVDDVHDLARVLAASLDTSAGTDEIRVLLAGAASEASAYESVGTFVEAWKAAIGVDPGASHPDVYTPTRNPYKGLRAFGELDAQDFHGRDAEVRDIIDTLAERRLVAVIGPSGIGKSSAVRAGMVPALRDGAIGGSEDWLIADMLPGAYPYEELASALVRVAAAAPPSLEEVLRSSELGLTHGVERYLPDAQAVLLIIDQFEELFTLALSEERRSFLAMLAATIRDEVSRVRIVVTMRADFFDRPLRFPDLGAALRDGTVPISAPSDTAVAEIVERPAAGVGVRFEPGLIDRVVSDVKDQPGALPLLEYALTELFNARETDTLTLETYAATGGVLGALGRRAETIYQNLDAAEQDACRQIFLRLVRVSETGRDTRRRIRLTELTRLGLPKRIVAAILNIFGDHRLLTFDRDPATRVPTVEVAHEAILTEWLRLADWIEEQHEDLLLHSRLATAVADWEVAARSETYLLTAGRLGQHEAWTADTEFTLTSAEREFLDASRTREDAERASRRRRRRLIMTGFGAAALIAVLLATVALLARNDAQDNERLAEAKTAEATANAELAEENEARAEEKTVEAEAHAAQAAEERTIALAGQLGAAALDEISSDPERAVLLGIESLNRATTPSGLNATHAALFRHYAAWVLGKGPLNFLMDVPFAIHPDGRRVLVVEGVPLDGHVLGVVAMYDVASPSDEPLWRAQIAGSGTIEDLPFVWFDEDEVLISISDIGTSEATTNSAPSSALRGIQVLDMATGDLVESIQFDGCVGSIIPAVPHLGRKSPLIVIYGGTSESGECLSWGNPIGSVEYRPDGPVTAKPVELAFPDPFRWVKYTPRASDDGTLVAFGNENAVFVFDAGTGEVVEEYDGNRIAISGSGDRVIIDHRTEGYAELIDRESGDTLVTFPGEFLGNFSFSLDHTRFIAGSYDGATHVFDVETGLQIHELRGTHYNPVFLDLSDDPDTFLTGSYDSGRVINLGDRSEIEPPIGDLGSRLESWGFTGHHAAVTTGGNRAYVPFVDDEGAGYRIYDLDNGSVIREATSVWRVAAMSPDGRYVVEVPGTEAPDGETREAYGAMQLVDAATGAVILVFENTCGFDASPGGGPPYDPQELCEDGQLISPLSDIEFSADGSRIAIDSWANTTAVFSTSTGSPMSSIRSDRDGFFDLDGGVVGLSPDGNTLLYRSTYEPGQGSPLTMVDIDANEVVGVAYQFNPNYEIEFSADAKHVYTANWAGIVYVYDVETFELVDTLTRGQGGGILDVAVRENLVATATFDKVVRVQTLDTHELMLEVALDVKAENVEFLNDDHLLVVTLDGDPLVFTMDGDELAEVARQRLTRGFTAEECASFSLDSCPTLEEIRGS
ncbi:MAG: protein kinase, partial [Actinomycetota bacterium]